MKGLITLCARGGSKGIPGKNIKKLNGKILAKYSIDVAVQFSKVFDCDIFLSSDCEQIIDVIKTESKDVDVSYRRPDYLATDSAGKLDVIKDLKEYAEEKKNTKYDFVIDLDLTSPLRTVVDLENGVVKLMNNNDALNLFSVSLAGRNPYFNMVEENEFGFAELCKKGSFLTRQSAPKVYDLNASFYIYKKSFFEDDFKTVITDKSIIYEMDHLCFDLDHLVDFEFMEFLIRNNKLDFDFNY